MNEVGTVKKHKIKMWQIILIALVLGMIFGITLSALGGTKVG
jgi:L-cystine uptake protein TcyP (sodium:dicarboxylate symporter family)